MCILYAKRVKVTWKEWKALWNAVKSKLPFSGWWWWKSFFAKLYPESDDNYRYYVFTIDRTIRLYVIRLCGFSLVRNRCRIILYVGVSCEKKRRCLPPGEICGKVFLGLVLRKLKKEIVVAEMRLLCVRIIRLGKNIITENVEWAAR